MNSVEWMGLAAYHRQNSPLASGIIYNERKIVKNWGAEPRWRGVPGASAWVHATARVWLQVPFVPLFVQSSRRQLFQAVVQHREAPLVLPRRGYGSRTFRGVSLGERRKQHRARLVFDRLRAKAQDTGDAASPENASGLPTETGTAVTTQQQRNESIVGSLLPFLAKGIRDGETLEKVFRVLLILALGPKQRRPVQSRSAETRERIAAALRGRKRPKEVRQRIAASLRGRSLSDAHRRRIQEALSGEKNPMYGRRRSDEERARIREAVLRTLEERGRRLKARQESLPTTQQSPGNEPLSPNAYQYQPVDTASIRELVGMIWHHPNTTGALLETISQADDQGASLPEQYRNESTERKRSAETPRRRENKAADTASLMKRLDANTITSPRGQGHALPLPADLVYTSARSQYFPTCTACNGRGLVLCPYCVERFGHCNKACVYCRGSGIGICGRCQGTRHYLDQDVKSYRI
jgi:hypothetical protein